jgi:hypothetical protein
MHNFGSNIEVSIGFTLCTRNTRIQPLPDGRDYAILRRPEFGSRADSSIAGSNGICNGGWGNHPSSGVAIAYINDFA